MSPPSSTTTRQAILDEIQIFVSETGLVESALGRRAVGSPGVVQRLREGKSITIDTLDALRRTMAEIRAARELDQRREAAGQVGAAE